MRMVVYTPESRLRKPTRLAAAMWADLRASKELAWHLFVRDLKANYRRAQLGFLWALLPAFATALIWTFVGQSRVVAIAPTAIPYPVYVVVGMLLWQTFLEALNAPLNTAFSEANLFTSLRFPAESLVLARLYEVVMNATIRVLVIICVLLFCNIEFSANLLWAPLAVAAIILLGTFIGALLTPIGLLYGDLSRFLNLSSTLWFLLTPIFYPMPVKGLFAAVVSANPVTPLLVTARELFAGVSPSCLPGFIIVSSISLAGLAVAWLLFKLAMPFVVERKF